MFGRNHPPRTTSQYLFPESPEFRVPADTPDLDRHAGIAQICRSVPRHFRHLYPLREERERERENPRSSDRRSGNTEDQHWNIFDTVVTAEAVVGLLLRLTFPWASHLGRRSNMATMGPCPMHWVRHRVRFYRVVKCFLFSNTLAGFIETCN